MKRTIDLSPGQDGLPLEGLPEVAAPEAVIPLTSMEIRQQAVEVGALALAHARPEDTVNAGTRRYFEENGTTFDEPTDAMQDPPHYPPKADRRPISKRAHMDPTAASAADKAAGPQSGFIGQVAGDPAEASRIAGILREEIGPRAEMRALANAGSTALALARERAQKERVGR